MPGMSARHHYLTRHAEPDEAGRLTERGARQAALLGRRLASVPFASVRTRSTPSTDQV